jgi:secreted trypsin-like serine protease
MKVFIVVLALFALGEARPSVDSPRASLAGMDTETWIIGGTDAQQGVWKWQLSQQLLSGTEWSHSCGASLLSTTTALSAAHCVDGSVASNIRVLAGLYQRSDTSTAQTVACTGYTMHERYNQEAGSFSNDIAIIQLAAEVVLNDNVALLTLPSSGNDFAGATCTITGWGRTSIANTLPDILQEAEMGILTTDDCATRMADVSGVSIWDQHICVYDSDNTSGGCNGDSGGPLNCPDGSGGYYVAGITSFVVTGALSRCLPSYPTVYTRTTSYLDWIASNL